METSKPTKRSVVQAIKKLINSFFNKLIILISFIFIALFIYTLVIVQVTPVGKKIPTEPPNEANRVTHPTGLSIIAPINWEHDNDNINPLLPEIRISAKKLSGGRHKAYIRIEKLHKLNHPKVGEFKDYHKIIFQSFPAYETMHVHKNPSAKRTHSNYYMSTNRNGEWWSIMYLISGEVSELPKEIRQYINTIKFPANKTNKSKTNLKN